MYKILVFGLTLFACALVFMIFMAIVGVEFTLVWLLPIIGGLFIGLAVGAIQAARRKITLDWLLKQENQEAAFHLVIGLTTLVIGSFLV